MIVRLDVFQDHSGYFVVAWDDEGYPGLELGDAPEIDSEHKTATDAASACGAAHSTRKSDGTLLFATRTDATKALRAARAALRAAKAGVAAMPDWAIKASAEGWTQGVEASRGGATMTIERKTELGRDLQCRADVCQVLLGKYMTPRARAILKGKAQAYAHAAELADASEPAPDESGVDEYDRHRDAKIAHAALLATPPAERAQMTK